VNSPKIQPGSRVSLHFRLMLEDSTVVDSSYDNDEPLSLVVGDGTLIESLEATLMGLAPGAKQSAQLAPENAYGFTDESNIHTMKRSEFDASLKLEPGVVIGFDAPSGEQVSGTIVDVVEQDVRVDFSHPLANRTVIFEVEILKVELAAK